MKNIFKIFSVLSLIALMSVMAFALPNAVTVGDTVSDECVADETAETLEYDVLQDGTEAHPYLITCPAQFNEYANLVNTQNSTYGSLYYKLTCNLDFEGVGLVPFGMLENAADIFEKANTSKSFKGTFDGNGFAILNVKVPNAVCSGVIGYMTSGTVKNLKVSYADATEYLKCSNIKYFGGIVGAVLVASKETVSITGCYSEGNVMIEHTTNGIYDAGIVGRIRASSGNANISDCLSYLSLDIYAKAKNGYAGGFVAHMTNGASYSCVISDCVSYGDVSFVTDSVESKVGGFAGIVQKDEGGWSGWASEDGDIMNCAAFGDAYSKASSKAYVGRFAADSGGEGTFVFVDCYTGTSQTIEAVAKNTCTGKDLNKVEIADSDFFKNTLGLNFDEWYMTASGLGLRTVARSLGAAVTDENKDVRLSSKPGIRFRSEIDVEKRDYAVEYGLIVVSKKNLGDKELTLDFDGNIAVGIAYGEGVDRFIEKDDESLVFSAVVVNIKEEHYGNEIVARSYVKYESEGKTHVVYGNPVTTSINASALAVRNSESYEYLTDAQKTLLETMLPKA